MTGSVRYCIKHTSRYVYSSPVSKSAMTLCFRLREDDGQSLLSFEIETIPAISLTSETDYFGNIKHFLIIHQPHESLEITALSTVEPGPKAPLPESLAPETWAEIQAWRDSVEYWDFMHPSRFARSCPALSDFMSGHGLDRAEGTRSAHWYVLLAHCMRLFSTCRAAHRRCLQSSTFWSLGRASARTTHT